LEHPDGGRSSILTSFG